MHTRDAHSRAVREYDGMPIVEAHLCLAGREQEEWEEREGGSIQVSKGERAEP